MNDDLTPLVRATIGFAYLGGLGFVIAGIHLSVKRRRLHPLLLVCISTISFSWIEAPYDWAVYAQFPPAIPRMPSWWPMDMTWGGLPASVPPGYISYFALPPVIGAALGQRLHARYGWRRPQTLLATGFVVGFAWTLVFNAFIGARLGVFHYGRVIPGLALWEGTKHQYPLYDALALGIQAMLFTYLLGRTDAEGRTPIEAWADARTARRTEARTSSQLRSALLSVAAIVVIGHALYGAVFAPHLATKLAGQVTAGPDEQLFEGVPNQPLHGGG
jgi:hypothetical protein